jgi:hypothetical protein
LFLNKAYDPAAVNSPESGDDYYEEALRACRVHVAARPALFAQEHYTEGPIWRVQLIRVKPTHMDDYLASLQQSTKPLIDEEKRQGIVVDYKIFLKETKNTPEDWDICVAIEYKNHAAMDGLTARGDSVRDKILGGKAQAQQLAEKRVEIREIISSELLQEIFLK